MITIEGEFKCYSNVIPSHVRKWRIKMEDVFVMVLIEKSLWKWKQTILRYKISIEESYQGSSEISSLSNRLK